MGRILYCNPQFVSITGYTLTDIPSGREWFRKAFPDQDQKEERYQRLARRQRAQAGQREFSVVCKDDSVKDIEFRSTRLENANSITMIADITRRKQAEEALRRTEEKYRDIYENTIEGIFQQHRRPVHQRNPALGPDLRLRLTRTADGVCHSTPSSS